jgi:hypothetical protein
LKSTDGWQHRGDVQQDADKRQEHKDAKEVESKRHKESGFCRKEKKKKRRLESFEIELLIPNCSSSVEE